MVARSHGGRSFPGWRRRESRPARPQRLDARGWDLALLGLVLFALMVGIAYVVTRLPNG